MTDRNKRHRVPWGTSKRSVKRRAVNELDNDFLSWTCESDVNDESLLSRPGSSEDQNAEVSKDVSGESYDDDSSIDQLDDDSTCFEIESLHHSTQDDVSEGCSSLPLSRQENCSSIENEVLPSQDDDDEWYDASEYGFISCDCDLCFNCVCINCSICVHTEEGDCNHCDFCVGDEIGSVVSASSDSDISDDDSEESFTDPSDVNKDILNEFIHIALSENLTHQQINSLLLFFKKWNFGNFPKCAKTLLKTPISYVLREVKPGFYWHRGIRKDLEEFIEETDCNEVHIKVAVDGLPLARSSGSNFWPVMCSFNQSQNIALAGVYHGAEKPKDSNDFLKDFIDEIIPYCENGINYNGRNVSIYLDCAVCDAPAKAFILNVKGHNGYYGCTKCTTKGKMYGRRMSYPHLNAPLRSDSTFKNKEQADYHLEGESDLLRVPRFGLVSCVVLDYMHLILLGVIKKIMYMWINGPLTVRLSQRLIDIISGLLMSLAAWTPSEFVRKPRSLKYIKRFKATEFRQMLLYTGPVVFKNVLRETLYDHFLILHSAVYILAHPILSQKHLSYADQLLRFWVERFKALYGKEFISHNVHGLIHIAADVKKFGNLDRFSAFPFENFLQKLKKLMRKSERPLAQLIRRLMEFEKVSSLKEEKKKPKIAKTDFFRGHSTGPLSSGTCSPQYYGCTLPGGISLNCKSEANNCCKTIDGSVIIIKNFAYSKALNCMVVIGKKFIKTEDLYTYPLKSSLIGINYVYNLNRVAQCWPISQIESKCYRMPYRDGFAIVPILHHV